MPAASEDECEAAAIRKETSFPYDQPIHKIEAFQALLTEAKTVSSQPRIYIYIS